MKNIKPRDCVIRYVFTGCLDRSGSSYIILDDHSVSSTLDSSSGKKNLLDGSDETCWSSAQVRRSCHNRSLHVFDTLRIHTQGLPQTIHLNWKELIPATHFALTFQGGFSATAVSVYVAAERPGRSNGDVALGMAFGGKVYPKDGNGRQVFE